MEAQRASPTVVFAPAAQPGGAGAQAPRVRFRPASATCFRGGGRGRPGLVERFARPVRWPRGSRWRRRTCPAFEAALRGDGRGDARSGRAAGRVVDRRRTRAGPTSIAPPPTCCATAGLARDRAGPSRCSTELPDVLAWRVVGRTPPWAGTRATTAGASNRHPHLGGWDGAEPSLAAVRGALPAAGGRLARAAMKRSWWSNTAKRPESLQSPKAPVSAAP